MSQNDINQQTKSIDQGQQPEPILEKISPKSKDKENAPNIQKRTYVTAEIGSIVTIALLVTSLLITYLANDQVKAYRLNRQQMAAALYNSSDLQNTVSFLENEKQQIETINAALPNEVGFIEFVRTLELLAREQDPNSQFEFDKGIRDGNVSYVPVRITLVSSQNQLSDFLSKLEKIPYIFHINTIDATQINPDSGLWQFRLSGRVFVNNNFRLEVHE